MVTKLGILATDKKLVEQVYNFYLSKAIDENLFNDIVATLLSIKTREDERNRIKSGMFSFNHFLVYLSHDNNKKILKGGIDTNKVIDTLDILEEKVMVRNMGFLGLKEKAYQCCVDYVKFLHKHNLINNLIFGFDYIIEKYKSSVFKIENTDINDDIDLGTGFLFSEKDKYYIITNDHVLSNSKKIRVLDKDDNEFNFQIVFKKKEDDIAIIELLDIKPNSEGFVLSGYHNILSEIITIGYPSIPMTKYSYQVCHKGEINSYVEDFQGNEMFLISAKTSSGNSGSPVIDKTGMVVGIISRELYEKSALIEKGKLPYYAVIPSSTIVKNINSYYTQQRV